MRKLVLLMSLLLSACSTPMTYYQDTQPQLKLEEFFNGKLTAYGMVQDRGGRVLRRFTVDMTGSWDNNQGTLDEWFTYDDGEQQRRIWHLEKIAEGKYIGNADDVASPADGEINGYALNWQYSLNIKVDEENWVIDFDDWMYLINDKRLINRAEMSKWGFRVGEVTLWIEKS